jgi:hypothetical protein
MQEQPIRSNWAFRTHEFCTTMLGEIPARIIEHYHTGSRWTFPAPWDRADYPDIQDSTYGTPGPDFYASTANGSQNPWLTFPGPSAPKLPASNTSLRHYLFPKLPQSSQLSETDLEQDTE